MARLLKELVNIQHTTTKRFISTFVTQQTTPSTFAFNPQLFANQSVFNTFHPPITGFGAKVEETGAAHLGKLQTHPSFSLGYFLEPNLPSGSGLSQVGRPGIGAETEHPGMMWADSVKKKRKKKMNKHKYKKLRKRLRRKTKT